jgi:hypothetical protein
MTDKFVKQFRNYNAAESHCWDWKLNFGEIEQSSVDCMARKDNAHAITTYMSTRFSSQYSSIETAIQDCWLISGILEPHSEYKTLSRYTASDSFFSSDMHRDHVDSYQEKQEMRQEIFKLSVDASNKNVSADNPQICDFTERAGVEIKISDSNSHENLACKANVKAIREGPYKYTEVLSNYTCLFLGYLQGLMELPGVYDIIVDVPGYNRWKKRVELSRDICHVHTVKIDLLLDPIE